MGRNALEGGASPSLGPLLETFVAGELARQRTWSAVDHAIFHYRDRTGPEVDLVLESREGRVAGVEVKAGLSVLDRDFHGLRLLRDRVGDAFTHGAVLYLGADILSFGDRMTALPVSALWAAAPRIDRRPTAREESR